MRLISFLLCFSAVMASSNAFADDLVSLSSDKPSYAAGEAAILRARFVVRPSSPDLEYFVNGHIGGGEISFAAVAEDDFLAASRSWWKFV